MPKPELDVLTKPSGPDQWAKLIRRAGAQVEDVKGDRLIIVFADCAVVLPPDDKFVMVVPNTQDYIDALAPEKWETIYEELEKLRDVEWDTSPCEDCQKECRAWADMYMAKDEIWAEAGMGELGYLCIECLEKRLGRQTTRADFTDVPLNEPSYKNSTLRQRLES